MVAITNFSAVSDGMHELEATTHWVHILSRTVIDSAHKIVRPSSATSRKQANTLKKSPRLLFLRFRSVSTLSSLSSRTCVVRTKGKEIPDRPRRQSADGDQKMQVRDDDALF